MTPAFRGAYKSTTPLQAFYACDRAPRGPPHLSPLRNHEPSSGPSCCRRVPAKLSIDHFSRRERTQDKRTCFAAGHSTGKNCIFLAAIHKVGLPIRIIREMILLRGNVRIRRSLRSNRGNSVGLADSRRSLISGFVHLRHCYYSLKIARDRGHRFIYFFYCW